MLQPLHLRAAAVLDFVGSVRPGLECTTEEGSEEALDAEVQVRQERG
jgi:hypothetical protein